MSPEERMQELEKKLEDKLDQNLLATNELNTTVKLLSQAIGNKDEAFKKFERRTEVNEERIFTRLAALEKDYAAGQVDRETMADSRKIFIKWIITSVLGLIVTFGVGLEALMTQISKLG